MLMGQEYQMEDFVEQFTHSVVAHFPRLTGPERRKLFTSLLPLMHGEDLLHLSQLISPFLRRDFLGELPAEISLHVLGFIDDPKDLVRASRVSKTWRSLVMDEQTWKAMLQKYRGRGWWSSSEANKIRPPIERIRQSHPEATFAVTSPPAAPVSRRNTLVGAGAPVGRQSLATGGLLAPTRRTSALSPTAQPFQSRRQSVSMQSALAEYAGPVASTSSRHQPGSSAAGSSSSEVGVNRFLDENQTPAAERRRRLKGKGRQSALEAESVVPPSGAATARPTALTPAAYALQGLGFSARRQSHQLVRSPNAPIPQPLPNLLPPPPQDLASQMAYLSISAQQGTDSTVTSPSARFAPMYTSPVAAVHPALATSPSAAYHAIPAPPSLPRRTSFLPPVPLSAPQPVRYYTRKSQNPFGTAVVTTPSVSPTTFYANNPLSSASAFSYKTQFKKAYLTESNWLKGPGRLLSRQTSTDEGVVTSLGFDDEWIIVGMATNQIHVFDSRTGEYARQLEGHALGVWCLVLVSKGGERLDKDGKKVKVSKTSWDSDESVEASEAEGSESEEEAGAASADEAYRPSSLSQHIPRCRSASARPPNRERFFQNESPLPESAGTSAPPVGAFLRTKSSPNGQTGKHRPSAEGPTASKGRRPSSFCGLPTANERKAAPTGSGLFGDSSRFSQQQAAACGTATGWGQRGAIAVTGGCDRDVRVWDVETG